MVSTLRVYQLKGLNTIFLLKYEKFCRASLEIKHKTLIFMLQNAVHQPHSSLAVTLLYFSILCLHVSRPNY